jgi:pimeloyl-ACP methyl ester carboxylesterase
VFSSTAGRMDLAATYAMMERLGGPEARRIAEEFWTDPTEARAGAYIETCMPLYTPGEARDGGDRKRAILRTAVMFHFIEGEQRTMNLLTGLAAVRCPTLVLAGAHDPITPVAGLDGPHNGEAVATSWIEVRLRRRRWSGCAYRAGWRRRRSAA